MGGSGISTENKLDPAYNLNRIHHAQRTSERIPDTPSRQALLFVLLFLILQSIFLWSGGTLPLGANHA